MPSRHRVVALSLLAATAVLVQPGYAKHNVFAPRSISGKTPFRDTCGAQGEYQRSAEVEPSLAVNPKDPQNVVAFWQQDRSPDSSGGSLANIADVSRDGGQTWRKVLLPRLTRCTGGSNDRASDPWVSFGGDGTLYAASLIFSYPPLNLLDGTVPDPTAGVVVSRSTNGGASWSAPVTVQMPQRLADKDSITADPRRRGTAYVTWWEFAPLTALFFSRTGDGGKTFSTPSMIYVPRQDRSVFPGEIVLPADGSLLDIFVESPGANEASNRILAIRSTDRGDSWSDPVEVARVGGQGAQDSETGQSLRANLIPSVALGKGGTDYVVWPEISSPTASRVWLARTTNGGRSFERPRAVANIKAQSFFPDVAVARDGTVGVIYYDLRRDRPRDAALSTDLWFSESQDGGRTWRERHLAGPFDIRTAPKAGQGTIPLVASGYMIGDYESLVPMGDGFGAVFVQARPAASAGQTDIFFARIALAR